MLTWIFMTQNIERYRLHFLHNYHNANQPINYSVIHAKIIKIWGKLNNCFWRETHTKIHNCDENVRQFGWKCHMIFYFIQEFGQNIKWFALRNGNSMKSAPIHVLYLDNWFRVGEAEHVFANGMEIFVLFTLNF